MGQAIYGLAMPFNDSYWEFNKSNSTFEIEVTNRESVNIDELVVMTIDHDYKRAIGITGENVFLQVTDNGVFFKLIPDSPIGLSIYKKVKRGAFRHCSVSYFTRRSVRNAEREQKALETARMYGINDDIIIRDYKNILLFEICLTNQPANKGTFCSTDKNHPLLKDVKWPADSLIENHLSHERSMFKTLQMREIEKINQGLEDLQQDIEEMLFGKENL